MCLFKETTSDAQPWKTSRQLPPNQRHSSGFVTEHCGAAQGNTMSSESGYSSMGATHRLPLRSSATGFSTGNAAPSYTINDILRDNRSSSDDGQSSHSRSSGISSAQHSYSSDSSSPAVHRASEPQHRFPCRQVTVAHRTACFGPPQSFISSPAGDSKTSQMNAAAAEVDRHFQLASFQQSKQLNRPRKIIMVESAAHYSARHDQSQPGVYPLDTMTTRPARLHCVKSHPAGHHFNKRPRWSSDDSELLAKAPARPQADMAAQRSASATNRDLFMNAFGGMFHQDY